VARKPEHEHHPVRGHSSVLAVVQLVQVDDVFPELVPVGARSSSSTFGFSSRGRVFFNQGK